MYPSAARKYTREAADTTELPTVLVAKLGPLEVKMLRLFSFLVSRVRLCVPACAAVCVCGRFCRPFFFVACLTALLLLWVKGAVLTFCFLRVRLFSLSFFYFLQRLFTTLVLPLLQYRCCRGYCRLVLPCMSAGFLHFCLLMLRCPRWDASKERNAENK